MNYSYSAQSSLNIDGISGEIIGYDSLTEFAIGDIVTDNTKVKTEVETLCELYDKVGFYYGWSWKEFEETPIEVIEELSTIIDKKLSNLDERGSIFNWRMLETLLAIGRAFGGNK